VAAVGLPMPKLMMLMSPAVAHGIGLSAPMIGKEAHIVVEIAQQYILAKSVQSLPRIPRQPVLHNFLLGFHEIKLGGHFGKKGFGSGGQEI
jgi:hypothetical protein